MHKAWIAIALSISVLWSPSRQISAAPATGASIEDRAQALEKLLSAPCCYKGTLEDHTSPVATQMREEIRAFLREGKTRPQILAHYKAKYGQAVLVEPPKGGLSGFMLYGIPFGLAVLGLTVMTAFMVRRRRDTPEATSNPDAVPADIPPRMQARIDALVAGEEAKA